MKIHIIPLNDKIDHIPGGECCNPHEGDWGQVVHHSKDKREQFERNGMPDAGGDWAVVSEEEGVFVNLPDSF